MGMESVWNLYWDNSLHWGNGPRWPGSTAWTELLKDGVLSAQRWSRTYTLDTSSWSEFWRYAWHASLPRILATYTGSPLSSIKAAVLELYVFAQSPHKKPQVTYIFLGPKLIPSANRISVVVVRTWTHTILRARPMQAMYPIMNKVVQLKLDWFFILSLWKKRNNVDRRRERVGVDIVSPRL